MTNDINEEFHAAAEIYAQRLRDERERRENPRKSTEKNADLFGKHLTDQLDQQPHDTAAIFGFNI